MSFDVYGETFSWLGILKNISSGKGIEFGAILIETRKLKQTSIRSTPVTRKFNLSFPLDIFFFMKKNSKCTEFHVKLLETLFVHFMFFLRKSSLPWSKKSHRPFFFGHKENPSKSMFSLTCVISHNECILSFTKTNQTSPALATLRARTALDGSDREASLALAWSGNRSRLHRGLIAPFAWSLRYYLCLELAEHQCSSSHY